MTKTSPTVSLSLIILLVCLLIPCKIHAQAQDEVVVTIDKVEEVLVTVDKFGNSRPGSGSRDQKWVLIEFAFTVTPPTTKEKNPYIDELQFKANIEARDEEGDPRDTPPVILTGEVTYMYVPAGKQVYGSFYIPADVATRFHVDQYLSRFNVNIQALAGSKVIDSKDKKREDKADWFAGYKTVSGVVFTKNQSPFILNDTDRYPTIKLSK